MNVIVAARDVRVRRALSSLLESNGNRIVAAIDVPRLLPELDAQAAPDLVVLELNPREDAEELRVIEELARRGRAVIAVCSRSASCAAVLAAGAWACLDKDARFADRLAEAVRVVSETGRPTPQA